VNITKKFTQSFSNYVHILQKKNHYFFDSFRKFHNLLIQHLLYNLLTLIRDVPDIRFWLAGYPAIFLNPVPAKTVLGTGYLNQIVLGPFWQLVELSSPSKWVPTVLHILVVDLCSVWAHKAENKHREWYIFYLYHKVNQKNSLLCNKYPDIWFRPDTSFDIRYYLVLAGF